MWPSSPFVPEQLCTVQPDAAVLQVMGPDDSYLLQYGRDTRPFWASQDELLLGACFRPQPGQEGTRLASRLASDPAQLQVIAGTTTVWATAIKMPSVLPNLGT